ncbi:MULTISPECIES: acetate/propionate family kinase [Clostridiaceae]|uniref:Acetate kinase n=1 Tax=Clostridium facile TaxID=2763035 RepID=A0ABR7ITY2_9CLOT|nr:MULTISPECIES: acetate kinase [Clostridiaceae]MBC5788474.1 acetate kinase [Clostridium facile]
MKILVSNAGSSSLKYQLINMDDGQVIAKGVCGRIGIGGEISHKTFDGRKFESDCDFPTHTEAFQKVVELLISKEYGVIQSMDEISAVGHRVVQGAEYFSESVLITPEVIDVIRKVSDLAPLHNPAHILAIQACEKVLDPSTPQVAVFDTAFHQTMPPKAFLYGVPYEYYEKYNIRKYGFHGTSHRFVSNRLAALLGKDIKDLKIITCHLGNGSSITAIDGGKSVDTTMGFTPLDGLLMGTRSGAVDPSVVTYIMEKENLTPAQMSDLLNKKSGYLGVSGVSSDDRDLKAAAEEGNKRAQITREIQSYQIKKYIGSYAAAMGGVDAIVFTGGIGEHNAELRYNVCSDMEFMGIAIDAAKNEEMNAKEAKVSAENSKVQVWVIPTNEELLIAQDTEKIVNGLNK